MLQIKTGPSWQFGATLAMLFAVALLSGCAAQGGASDDKIGNFMVAPGKYRFYPCANLAVQATALEKREAELEALIARAGPGAGGGLVSALSYRPEYLQARANLVEVRKAQAEKRCPPPVAAAPPPPPAVKKPKPR